MLNEVKSLHGIRKALRKIAEDLNLDRVLLGILTEFINCTKINKKNGNQLYTYLLQNF